VTDSRDFLVTPEAVLVGLEPAGIGSRGLAWLIDALIQGAVLAVLLVSANLVADGSGGTAGLVIALAGVFLVLFGYPIAFEVLWQGRTPGKAVQRLRVVTVEGTPVRFRHSAVRASLAIVDLWLSGAAAGVLAVLFSRRSQRLGDLVAGTLVVSVPRSSPVAPARFDVPAGYEDVVGRIDLSGLGVDDLSAVRRLLLRSPSLAPDVRDDLAGRLYSAIEPRLGGVDVAIGRPADSLTRLALIAAVAQRRANPPPPPPPPPPTPPLPPPVSGEGRGRGGVRGPR